MSSIDLKRLNDLVWSEKFWLPENIHWPSLNQYRRLDVNHVLVYPILCGLIIYIVRILFENLIAKPVGRCLGIAEWPIKFKPNALLEAYYRTQAEPDEKTLVVSVAVFLAFKFKSADDVNASFSFYCCCCCYVSTSQNSTADR